MKKIVLGLFVVFLMLAVTGYAIAAGTATQSIARYGKDYVLTFTCTGDSSNGSIPNTDTVDFGTSGGQINGTIRGLRLKQVKAYPVSGGTAPDAADVFILDDDSLDLLGSEDGSTTAWAGLTLIHATLAKSVVPNRHLPRSDEHQNYWPLVDGVLTLKVSNQATISAQYIIELTFGK